MLTVGQLAKACDVRADTVRFYERIGLISDVARSDAGYRMFEESAAGRIRFIKNAQSMGFTLDEIKELYRLANENAPDCSRICEFAKQKARRLEQQIRQMRVLKNELDALVANCTTPNTPTESCRILERLHSKLGA